MKKYEANEKALPKKRRKEEKEWKIRKKRQIEREKKIGWGKTENKKDLEMNHQR